VPVREYSEFLDLQAEPAGSTGNPDLRPLGLRPSSDKDEPPIWRGYQDLVGNISPENKDVEVRRGFSAPVLLSELLSARPPTIYFQDGTTVHGATVYDRRVPQRRLTSDLLIPYTWPAGMDFAAET
jgi:hypothetical protein